jgi:hypothetical protein
MTSTQAGTWTAAGAQRAAGRAAIAKAAWLALCDAQRRNRTAGAEQGRRAAFAAYEAAQRAAAWGYCAVCSARVPTPDGVLGSHTATLPGSLPGMPCPGTYTYDYILPGCECGRVLDECRCGDSIGED